MRACRVLPGAAGCGRLLVAGPRPRLLPGGPGPSWATARRAAGRWPSPGLRVPQAAEAEQQVLRAGGPCGRFIARPQLARTVQRCLQAGSGPQPVVLECAPGPGVLTRTLLNAGVRVVALESHPAFLSKLQVLTAKPGELRIYQALSVLWQAGCDIQLLHMEPWSSFLTNLKNGRLAIPKSTRLPNDHLCLVRLTPQQNLFTGGLKPANSATFIFMVKQCLTKPRSKLIDRLNSWSLDNADKLLKALEIPKYIETGNVYPEDYKRLFCALQNSSVFTESWFHDEVLESIRNINL